MRNSSVSIIMTGLLGLAVAWADVSPLQAQDDPAKIFLYPPKDKKGGKGGKSGKGGTAPASLFVTEGFKVERLYSVKQATQGSWVAMTVDPQGRLVAGGRDDKGLFRITPPPPGGNPEETKVEKLNVNLSSPNGLLFAFNALYVMKCGGGKGQPSGLYRVTASKPDGDLDTVTLLRALSGQGDHGPHAILLTPGGKSLTVVCGDATAHTEFSNSRLPRHWGEDALYPLLSAFGNQPAPRGWMARVDPEGKQWELYSAGFRNEYDAAYNRYGDLFTYDSDMEWDIGLPWYRPSRVSLAVSGGDAGFRSGSRVMPPRYPDTVPPITHIGLGSPTGVAFGYGAKFPAKYQEALYINDHSYGRMLAVHLTPQGSAYSAEVETFLSGPGLALTDMVVSPKDGALYFCVGGNTQSALYRVTYTGKEPTEPSKAQDADASAGLRALRHQLEAFHGKQDPKAVETAWPHLASEDRFIRFAARIAIEHQNPKEWQDRAHKETHPVAATHALLALVRSVGKDPSVSKRKAGDPIPGSDLKAPILEGLDRIDLTKLNDAQKSDVLRVYSVLFHRLGRPDAAQRERIIQRLDPLFPAPVKDTNIGLNADLCELLCYLEAPGIQAKILELIAAAAKRPEPPTRAWTAMPSYQGPTAPSQIEELSYAWHLAYVKTGWTEPLRKQFNELWRNRFATFRGGNRFNQTRSSLMQTAEQDARPPETVKDKKDK